MREFLTYTGNQFQDTVVHALLLGYKPFKTNPSTSATPDFTAVYLRGDENGYLFWYSEVCQEISVVLRDFMAWTSKDVKTLQPVFNTGQWVLVKNKIQGWKLDIYSHLGTDPNFPHVCVSGNWHYSSILPFEGNEHLLGGE